MGIRHNGGSAWSMAWCPCADSVLNESTLLTQITRLGLLAVALSDGSLVIYAVPCPTSLKTFETENTETKQGYEDLKKFV